MAFAFRRRRRRQTGDVYLYSVLCSVSCPGEWLCCVHVWDTFHKYVSISRYFYVSVCGMRQCVTQFRTKFHWVHSSFPRSLFYRKTPSFRILFVFASLFAVVYVGFVFFMANEFFEWCADAIVLDRRSRSTCVSSISNATHKTYKNEMEHSYPRIVSVSVKSTVGRRCREIYG